MGTEGPGLLGLAEEVRQGRQDLQGCVGVGRRQLFQMVHYIYERIFQERQSVPVDPSKRPNPEEKGLPWRDVGELDTRHELLYADDPAVPCPVVKADQLSPDQQVAYIQWILLILKLDHKVDKDPRVYCAYCDMNNHPRLSCKHAWKHRNPTEKHHCTLCAGKHAPFLCPRAQVNGGPGQPNWYKLQA